MVVFAPCRFPNVILHHRLLLRGSSCFSLCLAVVLESFSLSPSDAFFTLAARSPSLEMDEGHFTPAQHDFFYVKDEERRVPVIANCVVPATPLSCNCNKEVDRRSLQGSVPVLLLTSGCGETLGGLGVRCRLSPLPLPLSVIALECTSALSEHEARLWMPHVLVPPFCIVFYGELLLLVFQNVDHRFQLCVALRLFFGKVDPNGIGPGHSS